MNTNTPAPAGVVSSTELGDSQASNDMLRSWLAEADASNDRLRKHLENVLEIAYTWQPSYATKMDLETLSIASDAIGYECTGEENKCTYPHCGCEPE